MTIYIPPTGSAFTDLSAAPPLLVNVNTAAGVNTGRVNVPVAALAGKSACVFYVEYTYNGDPADAGSISCGIYEDSGFIIFGFYTWSSIANAGSTMSGESVVFIPDLAAQVPDPLAYFVNNGNGNTTFNFQVRLFGYWA